MEPERACQQGQVLGPKSWSSSWDSRRTCLVARFVAGEANKRCRAIIGPLCWLLVVVASSSLVLSSEGLVARVVAATPIVFPIRLAGAGSETTPRWKGGAFLGF
jgi:hypothetical protein